MNTFHLFACSHGKFGTTFNTDRHDWADTGSFGQFVSEKLGLLFVNHSRPGGCNYHLFQKIMDAHLGQQIKKDDIVLVQWSYIDRANHANSMTTIMPHYTEFKDFYINYHDDLESLYNLLTFNFYAKNNLGCKYFFSLSDSISTIRETSSDILTSLLNDDSCIQYNGMFPLEYLRSLHDKKLFFECTHKSLEGHKRMSEIYLESINTKLNSI